MVSQRINYPIIYKQNQTGALKQNLFAAMLILIGLIALASLLLPPSYNTDLSLIGKGKPVIAVVYDNDNAVSLELMEEFNIIRDEYEHVIEFIAIDKNGPPGQQFLISNKISAANALYYSGAGERIYTLHGRRDALELKASIQQMFGL